MESAFGVPLPVSLQYRFLVERTIPSQISVHCSNLPSARSPLELHEVTHEYVPSESKGELPRYLPISSHLLIYEGTYIDPKLNARLIRSVMKYFEHLPYKLSNTWSLKKFLRNVGWSKDRNVGNALFKTRE